MDKFKETMPPLGLVGRCFHVFDEKGDLHYQGIVRGDLGQGNYLIQYFDWWIGEANTMAIVHITKMMKSELWQFYEDAEQMNFWYENKMPKQRRAAPGTS